MRDRTPLVYGERSSHPAIGDQPVVVLGRIRDRGKPVGMVEHARVVRAPAIVLRSSGHGCARWLPGRALDRGSSVPQAFALSRRRCWRSASLMAVSPMGLRLIADHPIRDASQYRQMT